MPGSPQVACGKQRRRGRKINRVFCCFRNARVWRRVFRLTTSHWFPASHAGRSRSLRLRLPGSRKTSFALSSPPPVPEDAAEDTAETVALQAMVIDQSCPQDRLLPRTDRAPPPPARAATAIFAASPYCRESIQRAGEDAFAYFGFELPYTQTLSVLDPNQEGWNRRLLP